MELSSIAFALGGPCLGVFHKSAVALREGKVSIVISIDILYIWCIYSSSVSFHHFLIQDYVSLTFFGGDKLAWQGMWRVEGVTANRPTWSPVTFQVDVLIGPDLQQWANDWLIYQLTHIICISHLKVANGNLKQIWKLNYNHELSLWMFASRDGFHRIYI